MDLLALRQRDGCSGKDLDVTLIVKTILFCVSEFLMKSTGMNGINDNLLIKIIEFQNYYN